MAFLGGFNTSLQHFNLGGSHHQWVLSCWAQGFVLLSGQELRESCSIVELIVSINGCSFGVIDWLITDINWNLINRHNRSWYKGSTIDSRLVRSHCLVEVISFSSNEGSVCNFDVVVLFKNSSPLILESSCHCWLHCWLSKQICLSVLATFVNFGWHSFFNSLSKLKLHSHSIISIYSSLVSTVVRKDRRWCWKFWRNNWSIVNHHPGHIGELIIDHCSKCSHWKHHPIDRKEYS